ncbi:DUF5133 domain-containing protein [Streptomyces sp. DT24]|uniref:DUF5133 domain-containing protein n=1 Tax=unclassified Streptomyces TaxID=2593676 RepID=UPI0023B958D0|nr:DUF5133 domain-containing protein [Streptomyces sp. AM 4-1-1]WEH35455.1 DUF5133 domain-containing protein [Streptomyces sp. AM 4-1-1]
MLVPHPQVLRTLLAQYATARIAVAENDTPGSRQTLESVVYTLCVATGTRTIRDALTAADALLENAAAARAKASSAPDTLTRVTLTA